MKATDKMSSVCRWQKLLDTNGIQWYYRARTIVIPATYGEEIHINHSSNDHWTIRIEDTAKDGMRFKFDVDVEITPDKSLIMINNRLAIKL